MENVYDFIAKSFWKSLSRLNVCYYLEHEVIVTDNENCFLLSFSITVDGGVIKGCYEIKFFNDIGFGNNIAMGIYSEYIENRCYAIAYSIVDFINDMQ